MNHRYLMNKFTSARYAGRHRSTPGQLMLQDAQRAERHQEWRRAELIEHGSRADWKLS